MLERQALQKEGIFAPWFSSLPAEAYKDIQPSSYRAGNFPSAIFLKGGQLW
jgi:hypothetical protein